MAPARSAHGLTSAPPADWRLQARCLGRWDEMHPENSETEIELAKQICKTCRVARECFLDAIATGDMEHGIRAGLKAAERRAVAKELERRRTGTAVAA